MRNCSSQAGAEAGDRNVEREFFDFASRKQDSRGYIVSWTSTGRNLPDSCEFGPIDHYPDPAESPLPPTRTR